MTTSQQKLKIAMQFAMANRPKVGGFPYLAECLRQAGVEKNIWALPGNQSIYLMSDGVIVQQGSPLIEGIEEVPAFDESSLIAALRADQSGKSSFPEFLAATWQAGVVGYEVDLLARTVTYHGARGENFAETYSAVVIEGLMF